MHATLDDLVIALYCVVDELLGPDPRRGYPGRKPRLSDAELICLAVAQVLLGCHSEHEDVPRPVELRWRPVGDQAASSLVGVTAMVSSRAARRAGRYR